MRKITAKEIYDLLTDKEKIVGETGSINFSLKDLSFVIKDRNIVGKVLQNWLEEWMRINGIAFAVKDNTQDYPDFFLDPEDRNRNILEVKAFDYNRSANFDVANFQAYCRCLKKDSFRLDADYLIFGYTMDGEGKIRIEKVWLKKVWEICGPSEAYPIKVQQKQKVIYNIMPIVWHGNGSQRYPHFNSKQEFVQALHNTLLKYPRTKDESEGWLDDVKKNYLKYTGKELFPKKKVI